MRRLNRKRAGQKLNALLNEPHPLDEDIGIVDEDGNVLGVVITPEAYEVFVKKIEEEEDRLDRQSIDAFRESRQDVE